MKHGRPLRLNYVAKCERLNRNEIDGQIGGTHVLKITVVKARSTGTSDKV